jgi:DME family drug/metabolite transporter
MDRIFDSLAARGSGGVLLAAALWGTVGPAQILSGSHADPAALGVARLLVGGVVLTAISGGVRPWATALRRDAVGWVALAALATGVYQVSFMAAVDRLGAALATAIALGVAPAATGVCARWWTGERFGAGWAMGTLCAVAGCVILLVPGGRDSLSGLGLATALVSGTCYGAYTVAAKRFLDTGVPPLPVTALTLVVAGVVLAPVMALRPEHLGSPRSVALVLWIGVIATAIAYAAFVRGLHRTTAATAGTLSLAEPLLAVLLGVAVLHEHLSAAAALGSALLVAGLVVVTVVDAYAARRPATREALASA